MAVFLLGIAALACSRDATIPNSLLGRWICGDARYAGRSLLITPRSLIFASDMTSSENFTVRGVETRVETDGTLFASIAYGRAGEDLEIRIRRFETDPPSLTIGDRPERWTLAPLNRSGP
jgi:hypothetical protein